MEKLMIAMRRFRVNATQTQVMLMFCAGLTCFCLVAKGQASPSGLQAIERSVREKGKDFPILAVTGYTSPDWVEGAYRAGADGVLHKPLDKDGLLETIQTLTSGLGSTRVTGPDATSSPARCRATRRWLIRSRGSWV